MRATLFLLKARHELCPNEKKGDFAPEAPKEVGRDLPLTSAERPGIAFVDLKERGNLKKATPLAGGFRLAKQDSFLRCRTEVGPFFQDISGLAADQETLAEKS
jgi:hypothetical protein